MRRPASTRVTGAPVITAIPRAAKTAWKRARNAAGKLGRMSGTSDTRTNDSRRASAADHVAAGEIEVDRFILIKPGAGEASERTGIDVRVVESVVASDEARQHSGIGCVHLSTDQSEAHARDGLHPEHAQHRDVGVAGADQH